jgi:hypothetical protein
MREFMRHPRKGAGDRSRPGTPTTESGGGPVAALLRLQRRAGNAAATSAVGSLRDSPVAVVQRAPAGAVANQALDEAKAAGDEAAKARAEAGGAQTTANEALAKANASLTNDQLNQLRLTATANLLQANIAYVDACNSVRDSIKASAKQDAEMMAMVLDIAMGFASPALAKGLAGIANRLPAAATTVEYRLALAALNTDNVKALLTGATKAAGQTLKNNAMALAGEGDIDMMLKNLKVNAQEAFHVAIEQVVASTDAAQIGAVAAAYHPSVTNLFSYEAEIKKICDLYLRDVSPIGSVTMGAMDSMPLQIAWVEQGGGKRLAKVRYHPGLFGLIGNKYVFFNWVADEMKDLAEKKQVSDFGRIETIKQSELMLFKP